MPKPSNKKINDLLIKADKLFEKNFSATELKILDGYAYALKQIKADLAKVYADLGDFPTITQVRKKNRLNALYEKITATIADKQKIELNAIASAKKNALLNSYSSTGFAIRVGSGMAFDFTILPQKSIEYVLGNDMWTNRMKDTNSGLLTNIKDEIERTFRKNASREVGAGLAQGKSYSQVAKAIAKNCNTSATRAKRIAFDQMHAGHMEGRNFGINKAMDSADRLGIKAQKIWKHYPGASKTPRPDHADMNNVPADKDGNFHLPSGGVGQAPGLIDNAKDLYYCHCSAVFEIEGLGE